MNKAMEPQSAYHRLPKSFANRNKNTHITLTIRTIFQSIRLRIAATYLSPSPEQDVKMPLESRDFYGALSGLSAIGVVEHAVALNFIDADTTVLAVGSRRVLDIYQVIDQDTSGAALRHLCRYPLFGVIQSLTAIPQPQGSTDHLLLTFDKGKACVVAYDILQGPHRLRTLQLFNFEQDALGSDIRAEAFADNVAGFGCSSVGLVDPLARCAAVMLYGSHIGIIPLSRPDELEEVEVERKAEVAPVDADIGYEMRPGCFLLSLEELGVDVGGCVRHVVFLEERHGSPVLAILHNTAVRTSAGRLVVARYTCAVSCVAVDVRNKSGSSPLFQVDGLPHDAHALAPTADGGFVVVSANAVIHLSTSPAQWEALYANTFAVVTVDNQRIKRRTTARMAVR